MRGDHPRLQTCLLAVLFVLIRIHSVYSASPVCPNSTLTVAIEEGFAVDTLIHTLKCTDADPGQVLTYMMTAGANTQLALSSDGKVTNIAEITYAGDTFLPLTFNVADDGSPVSNKEYTLTVYIDAVNNNDPFFWNSPYIMEEFEDIPVGELVIHLYAFDNDAGNAGQVDVTIMSGNEEGHFKHFDPALYISHALDYETTKNYSLILKAVDRSKSNPRTATATAIVRVMDVNDNYPNCTEHSFFKSIPEDKTTLIHSFANLCEDLDSGDFGTLSYSMLSGDTNRFRMVGNYFLTKGYADIETEPSKYYVQIKVSDAGKPPKSSIVEFDIEFTGIDDNPCYFPNGDTMTLNIPENAEVGNSVFVIDVADGDKQGTLGTEIRYKITRDTSNGAFLIQNVTNMVYLQAILDREVVSTYSIDFEVYSIDTSLAVGGTLNINVQDVNDNAPQFEKVAYQFMSPEDVTNVGTVKANDPDEGNNAAVTYSITAGNTNNVFSIGSTSGVIALDTTANYVTSSFYGLTIVAQDSGNKPLSSSCKVVLGITAVNKNAPNFATRVYTVAIVENWDMGKILQRVSADDSDTGAAGQITYAISITDGPFMIGATSGDITLYGSIDREKADKHFIEVTATDGSLDNRKTATATVSVTVDDVNDNIPSFQRSTYVASVDEGVSTGRSVTTVSASDKDSVFGTVTYSIRNDFGSSHFSVSASGAITTAAKIDFKTRSSYQLQVVASDNGNPSLTAQVLVEVSVNDINDNSPIFTPSAILAMVSENLQVDEIVVMAKAKDYDSGANAAISYAITAGNTGNAFAIGITSAVITVNGPLSVDITPSYSLTVVATDGGSPPNSASAVVSITILDYNDHAPVIGDLQPDVTLKENDPIGKVMFEATATDLDHGMNQEVSFSITGGNDKSLYTVSVDGVIKTMNSLQNQLGTYQLVLKATDGGYPPMSSSATLTVSVLKADGVPSSTVTFETLEGQDINTVIGSIATGGPNPNIQYSITQGNNNNAFKITTDGRLQNNKILDREMIANYYLIIHVVDLSNSALSKYDTVNVIVTDANDNPPVPKQVSYTADVVENTPIGQTVLLLMASDADAGDNSILTFSLDTSSAASQNVFAVSTSGVVTVKSPPDFEVNEFFDFNVIVQDQGTTPLSATMSIHIDIVNVEDTGGAMNPNIILSAECFLGAKKDNVVITMVAASLNLQASEVSQITYTRYGGSNIFNVGSNGGITVVQPDGLVFGSMNILWVSAKVTYNDGSKVTLLVLIRIDVFADTVILSTTLSKAEVQQRQQELLAELNKLYPAGRAGIWLSLDTSSKRRRLLATETQIYVYFIKDASVDTGISTTKEFLTADEVLGLINGASDVLNSKFSLTTVVPSVAAARTCVDPNPTVCIDQNVGIGIAAALGVVIVVLVITIIGCHIYRKRNDKDTDGNQLTPKDTKGAKRGEVPYVEMEDASCAM